MVKSFTERQSGDVDTSSRYVSADQEPDATRLQSEGQPKRYNFNICNSN